MSKLTTLFIWVLFATIGHAQRVTYNNPGHIPKPIGYSQVATVVGGKLIFISGQIGMTADGKMAADFTGQVKQAFANLREALIAAGAQPKNIFKINYYVVGLNADRLAALRAARDALIDQTHPPTSTLAGVQSLFREDCLIEIEAEAVIQ